MKGVGVECVLVYPCWTKVVWGVLMAVWGELMAVWGGLEVVWGGLVEVWGGLGCLGVVWGVSMHRSFTLIFFYTYISFT